MDASSPEREFRQEGLVARIEVETVAGALRLLGLGLQVEVYGRGVGVGRLERKAGVRVDLWVWGVEFGV